MSRGIYGGTPGRVFIKEDDGMVIVAGPASHRGHNQGLVIESVRTDDGVDHPDFFRTGGGYLTGAPRA